jgi:hypothetical protein
LTSVLGAQFCLRPILYLRRDTGFADTVGTFLAAAIGMIFTAIAMRLSQDGHCEQKQRGSGKQQSAHGVPQ